jgi:hypothetical protein
MMMGLLNINYELLATLSSIAGGGARRITGLEKTVERELEWRKESDFHYCSVINCELREPRLGTLKR